MANLDILIRARNEAQAALNELDKSLGGLRKQAGGLSSGLSGLGNVLKVGLVAGAGAAAAALGAVGAAALGVAQEFDDAQDTLIAMTGASGAALDGMSASVVALHGTVAGLDRSMMDIAAVMGEVNTRTGATGPALDTFSAQILKMTRITGDDGVNAVQKITRVMGDWSVPLEESSGLMDKLFGAGQTFGIGLDSLAGKLVQFGAPLRQMGFGLDESIAMLGKWEKEGVNTELVIGSLRIAAGKFAKEQGESNDAVVGGVKSLVDAQGQLDKLRGKLQLAQMQQAEFTDKTKASSRLSKEMQIAETTRQIQELESAMALGEFRTISSTAANKSLAESLRETFDQIKNASDGTEALNIGMEVFGARAGPDMTAAIREGRFELDDAIKAMDGMAGSIDDVAERTLGLTERWQMGMTRVKDSLLPVGNELMGLGLEAMPFVETAAGKLAGFLGETLPGVIGEVREAWAEDWGGIRSTVGNFRQDIEPDLTRIKIRWAIFGQEIKSAMKDAGIDIEWETLWGDITKDFLNWAGLQLTDLDKALADLRPVLRAGLAALQGDWDTFWKEFFSIKGQQTLTFNGVPIAQWLDDHIIGPVKKAIGTWQYLQSLRGNGEPTGVVFSGLDPDVSFVQPDPTGYVPGYARGTDFAPGGWAMVGERGPELVNLPRGSQVMNAERTAQALGGGSVVINNYVTVNNEQDIVSLTERILSQVRRQQGLQAWQPTF